MTYIKEKMSAVVDMHTCGEAERKLESASTHSIQTSKYNFHAHSSMQSLLTQYGLETDYNTSKQHSSSKKFTKKQRAFSDVDAKKEDTKMKIRKQYYTQIYDEMYKLRNYFRDEYMDRLEVKVKKQKAKALELDNAAKQREIQQKIKEREDKHHKRLERHDLVHDSRYLKKIPKSQYYKFAELERKLKAQGKLNTKSEVEEFWANIHSDDMLKMYVKLSQSGKEMQTLSALLSSEPRRPTLIIESRESPDESHVKHFVTRFIQASNSPHKNQDVFSIARQSATELDQKHPQLHLPNLHCFETEVLTDTLEDEMEKSHCYTPEHCRHSSYLKKLHRMYDLANSNNASTKRIFANHDNEFQPNKDGTFICDMIPSELIWPPREEPPSEIESRSESVQPWMRYIKKKVVNEDDRSTVITTALSKPSTPKTSSKSLPASTRHSRCTIECLTASQPLGLNELMEKSKIVEAQCKSTFWPNYMHAGKSAFATC